MEIFHDGSERRTILVTLDESADASDFYAYLAEDFKVLKARDARECLNVMHERFAELSAVIIDIDMAEADEFAFLRAVDANQHFDTIPIVIATVRTFTETDEQCFAEGALDVLTPPYNPALVKKRIDNAIRIKRSSTFFEIERMLRELPSNIFLKDAEGRYVFSTHYWHHLDTGGDPNWTIRGKTDLEIRKDRENAAKAMEADAEIIRTGKGTTYVIEINADGKREFMELIKRPVFDDRGEVVGIIALVNDVTDHELLKRELEQRAHTDELTELLNRRSFDETLRDIHQRNDFPIGVISADCDALKTVNDTFGHLVGDEYIRMAAVVFRSSLPDEAKAFRTGGDEFIALLPNTTDAEAQQVANDMRKRQKLFQLKEVDISMSFGVACIENADCVALDAIARADRAMYADKATHDKRRATTTPSSS